MKHELRKVVVFLGLLAVSQLKSGCKSAESSKVQAAADSPSQGFPSGRVMEVKLRIDAAKWDFLRKQGNDLSNFACGNSARVENENQNAQLWIDGEDFGKVKVRKKGLLGSQQQKKPSLKINLGKRKAFGLDRLVLNNNHQDPALMRQCLAYEAFSQAGLPAAACSFARVFVNGDDLGIYTQVEEYGPAYLRTAAGNPEDALIEGTVSDFSAAYRKTFEVKEGDTALALAKIAAITEILNKRQGDLVSQLSKHIDMDAFFRFWAVEVLVGHWDGYANNRNNFFMRLDQATEMVRFIPWGVDNVFHESDSFYKGPKPRPLGVSAASKLTSRLLEDREGARRYRAALSEVNGGAWASTLIGRAKSYKQLLGGAVDEGSFQQMLGFISARQSAIQGELAKTAIDWPIAYREGEPCLTSLGSFRANFSSTWLGDVTPGTEGGGSGEMHFTLEGISYDLKSIYSVAGRANSAIRNQPAVILVGKKDGESYIAQIYVEEGLYRDGGSMKYQGFSTYGVLLKQGKDGVIKRLGMISAGSLNFEKNGFSKADPVLGSTTAGLFTFL